MQCCYFTYSWLITALFTVTFFHFCKISNPNLKLAKTLQQNKSYRYSFRKAAFQTEMAAIIGLTFTEYCDVV